ncbi:MAG: flavin reductase [Alphaproteobacteria bacterium]|nr:flavin reductase [Alphaproteobacteria bacterium]
MSFDTRSFRDALGCFPTGVAVVTCAGTDAHIGITVNSFASVSLDPPLVLWCLDKKSDRFTAFTNAAGYTISLLGTVHRDVSSRLAKRGEHSLEGIELLDTELGPPALADSLAAFECKAHAVHDAGDHAILIGQVQRITRHDAGAPLVYFRGGYGALAGVE